MVSKLALCYVCCTSCQLSIQIFSESFTIWPDKKLGPFGPKDKRFPLPGNVGHTLRTPAPLQLNILPSENVDPDAIFDNLPSERYGTVLRQTQEDIESVRLIVLLFCFCCLLLCFCWGFFWVGGCSVHLLSFLMPGRNLG